MKKFITAVLLLSTVFFSCNQAVKGEYATVVLDLGGSASGARAIGQNGLPFLKDTHITIEAVGRLSGTFVKEFAPGEAGSIALRFIAGDTVRLRVKASNASGIWSGSTTFTVEEGTNAVSVKLNKTISGAQALTFSMTKFYDEYGTSYDRLDVYAGNKNIYHNTKVLSPPSFCRDAKGRIFVADYYNNGSGAFNLIRYDSEGNNPTTLINGEQSGGVWHLASDLVTGKVYALRYDKTLYEVGETGSYTSWTSASLSSFLKIDCIAAHGGQLFVLGEQGSDYKLSVYDIESHSTPPSFQLTVVTNKEIDEPPSGSTYTDMFVTDDSVYLLRKEYVVPPVSSGNVYSKGALIKYEYNKVKKKIDDREEFGKSDKDDENGIVPTGASCFYGPLKFIGFDDDVLYIADDGVTFEYLNKRPHIAANKNRIASFNTSTNSLSFVDTSATWAKEEKILPRKTLLWKKSATGGFDYYAVDSANASLGVQPNLQSLSNTDYYTDIFCFDQAGNLYVVKEESSGYKVMCYESTADGSYDFANALTPSSNPFGTDKITAITAGTIINGGNEYNALYYCYEYTPNHYKIKRICWQTTQKFSTAVADSSWAEISESSPVPLAANKDGLFVAINEASGFSINKFKHDDGSSDGHIEIHGDVGTINALQIADGVLYGISTKIVINYRPAFFNISGKLLKLGETDDDFGDDFDIDDALMYEEKDVNASSNGNFAPYRFIAVKPKKLVIASDGAYGKEGTTTATNSNRVLIFTLDDDSGDMVGDHPDLLAPDSRITFSKELNYNSGSISFDWK